MANWDAIHIDSSYSQPSTSLQRAQIAIAKHNADRSHTNRNQENSFNASILKSLSSNINNVSKEKYENEEESTRYSNYEPSCPPAQPTEGIRQTQNRSSDIGAAAVQAPSSPIDVNEEAPPSYYDAVHGDHKW